MMKKISIILEKILPCEYRDRCMAKGNIRNYQKEFYKSCRMSHQEHCITARLYSGTYKEEGFGLAKWINNTDSGITKRIEEIKNG